MHKLKKTLWKMVLEKPDASFSFVTPAYLSRD